MTGRRRLSVAVRGGLLVALAWVPALTRGQNPAPSPAAAPAGSRAAADLATRFQFDQVFVDAGQYQVGARETIDAVDELPQGAPDRQQFGAQIIYSERPAARDEAGKVKAVVRRYNAYRQTGDAAPTKPPAQRPLEGLLVWLEPRGAGPPQVISLTDGRTLRTQEFDAIASQFFLPSLSALFPSTPVRVGDRWRVSKEGAQLLLGAPLPLRSEPLSGTLVEVRQATQGNHWEAVMSVSGQAKLGSVDTKVNAQLTFAFPPPPEAAKTGEEAAPVSAHGIVSELRMARSIVAPQAPNSRLRSMETRTVILAVRPGDQGAPLAVPATAPDETPANSWLSYDDLDAKFHFRYPQEFHLPPRSADEFTIDLRRERPTGLDGMLIFLIIKTGDAEADRANRDPTFQVKAATEEMRGYGYSVIAGPQKWLPEADWAPLKRKVFRGEHVLMRKARGPGEKDIRVHFDVYLVLFGRDESLIIKTTTLQDPATPYRKEVEEVIKTFDFGATPKADAPKAEVPRPPQ